MRQNEPPPQHTPDQGTRASAELRESLTDAIDRSRRLIGIAASLNEAAGRAVEVSQWTIDDIAAMRGKPAPEGKRLIPICSYCRKLANASRVWAHVPERLRPSGSELTHSICRECWDSIPDMEGIPYPG
jgi:hypothetical protein